METRLSVAIDTEVARGKPWSVQLSVAPGTSYFISADDKEGLFYLQDWLRSKKPHIFLHNALFDLGVLRRMGIEPDDGQFTDTMQMAYMLQIEPQGLKELAYRHCGAQRQSYDEVVGPAQEEISRQYLELVTERADQWPIPEARVIWKAGQPKNYKPQPVAKRVKKILQDYWTWKNGDREEPVDLMDRWRKINEELAAPVVEVLGEMRKADLSDIDFDRAVHYACNDASDTLRIAPILSAKVEAMDLEEASRVDHGALPIIDRMQEVGIRLAGREFWDRIELQCEQQMDRAKWAIFQKTGEDINPASGDQVAELLYGKLKLKPPYMTDGGGRGSVDGIALESLLSQAPDVIQPVMDYTEANKIRGTYAVPLRKLAVRGERVHSTMRVTRTTTGRLSMADPPLHQIPIITDLGRQIRDGFIAEEGYVIGDWDLNQIEMRICAHESQDPELMRMFLEGKDVHTETAMKIFSVPRSALHVNAKGKVDDVRRIVAKHAAFGVINGITEHGLENYMILNRCKRPDGECWTLDDCVMLLREWFNVYKGVKAFHLRSIEETARTGIARESISGRVVYLPQIWSPVKTVRETAERMSYVMYTQGGAAALFKRILAGLWKYVKRMPEIRPLFWMHDEIACEVPDDPDARTAVDLVFRGVMESTVKLRVPVLADGGFGQSWGAAH